MNGENRATDSASQNGAVNQKVENRTGQTKKDHKTIDSKKKNGAVNNRKDNGVIGSRKDHGKKPQSEKKTSESTQNRSNDTTENSSKQRDTRQEERLTNTKHNGSRRHFQPVYMDGFPVERPELGQPFFHPFPYVGLQQNPRQPPQRSHNVATQESAPLTVRDSGRPRCHDIISKLSEALDASKFTLPAVVLHTDMDKTDFPKPDPTDPMLILGPQLPEIRFKQLPLIHESRLPTIPTVKNHVRNGGIYFPLVIPSGSNGEDIPTKKVAALMLQSILSPPCDWCMWETEIYKLKRSLVYYPILVSRIGRRVLQRLLSSFPQGLAYRNSGTFIFTRPAIDLQVSEPERYQEYTQDDLVSAKIELCQTLAHMAFSNPAFDWSFLIPPPRPVPSLQSNQQHGEYYVVTVRQEKIYGNAAGKTISANEGYKVSLLQCEPPFNPGNQYHPNQGCATFYPTYNGAPNLPVFPPPMPMYYQQNGAYYQCPPNQAFPHYHDVTYQEEFTQIPVNELSYYYSQMSVCDSEFAYAPPFVPSNHPWSSPIPYPASVSPNEERHGIQHGTDSVSGTSDSVAQAEGSASNNASANKANRK